MWDFFISSNIFLTIFAILAGLFFIIGIIAIFMMWFVSTVRMFKPDALEAFEEMDLNDQPYYPFSGD